MMSEDAQIMNKNAIILLVDDTPANLNLLVDTLDKSGFDILVATSGEQTLERCTQITPDLILLDVMLPGIDGFETCKRLKDDPRTQGIPVIFMTALADPRDKLRGFEAGGVDYVTKPIQPSEVKARIHTQLTLHRLQRDLEDRVKARTAELSEALTEVEQLKQKLEHENTWLRSELQAHQPYGDIIGQSPPVKQLVTQIELVAPTDASVLALGESGTGKELVAREIHRHSSRASKPIIKVNCGAIPKTLYESELFGHIKGAFTGAVRDRQGRFEAADGGTLFLDEVGEIPLELQSKLLRVLQEGTFSRVGEQRMRQVNVRIIAATNRDLKKAAQEGTFREDLYYRLNVFPIRVPPLRERRSDVPLLAAYFIEQASLRMGLTNPPNLPEEELERLKRYNWPGNIRELQNVVERAVIMSRAHGGRLSFASLGGDDQISSPIESAFANGDTPHSAPTILTEDQITELQRSNTLRALEAARWRIRGDGGAAERLGLKPTTLASRVKRWGLKEEHEQLN